MKDISASLMIDEAIQRLEDLKQERVDADTAIESLYVVRAYCELLLKTFNDHSRVNRSSLQSLTTMTGQEKLQDRSPLDDDEANGPSLLDF